MTCTRVITYLKMIKFSHSVFALPFAFSSAILAADGLPETKKIVWITAAMVAARSAAMGMNRVVDRKIDAQNPRTKNREIPAGVISAAEATVFVVLSSVVFGVAAYMLNPLCLKLSPVALSVIFLYSYTKRFTWGCHIVLGVAIALAPLGAWIAIRGTVSWEAAALPVAVVFWLAGFDILYALADIDFDKSYGLYSIPQRFGIRTSLYIARGFHLLTWVLLIVSGVVFHLGVVYYIGMAIVAMLLIYEHNLVRPGDLSKLDMAFFNMNGYISVTVLAFIALDKYFK
ncbi:UbiA-like polyprenyltransferase [Candidatus Magnetominusculus xianensis]|uniref:4-hydroxybenzoate octaprenyltransferase n=1 Tax=Candidatus Magnetominusculus xianensis TaxID=1748249 RepID=A0ABR5SAW3_9BACT|nr:UbiA-like polyprenyltransferase [Candidatus Magnetominusculus xianensis]KWT75004.1 4-hydroxybenzoate octaprenyltransferase [Candidatus Magnetominusculus xianensis]MBF0404935.1 UbiA family prenyltransferase [Nitrospirota bacterium]